MKSLLLIGSALLQSGVTLATPSVVNSKPSVTYQGLNHNGADRFLNIPYSQGTGGANQFKVLRSYIPTPGSIINV